IVFRTFKNEGFRGDYSDGDGGGDVRKWWCGDSEVNGRSDGATGSGGFDGNEGGGEGGGGGSGDVGGDGGSYGGTGSGGCGGNESGGGGAVGCGGDGGCGSSSDRHDKMVVVEVVNILRIKIIYLSKSIG
ncbi:unnamed protein product, partial [Prunus brigantina]